MAAPTRLPRRRPAGHGPTPGRRRGDPLPSGRPARSRLALLAATLATLLPGLTTTTADAARLDYTLGVSALHSDNIGASQADAGSDTVIAPSLRFDIAQEGRAARLDATGSLQYLDYLDDSFDDGFRGSLAGRGVWSLLPERLDLVAEDYLSRQAIDTLAGFSPGNEQQTNVFIAGPSLYGRLGPTTRAQLDLRYTDARAEDSDTFDSQRLGAAVRVVRQVTATRRMGLNLESTRVDFDTGPDSDDYRRDDGFVRLESELRRLELSLDVGYTRLRFDGARDDASAPLLRGRAQWQAGRRGTVDAVVGYQFADAAQELVLQRGGIEGPLTAIVGNPQVPVTAEVFRQRRAELGYRHAGERLGVELRPYYQRIAYLDAQALAQDQDSRGGLLALSWRLREATTLDLQVAHDRRDYDALDRRDRDSTARVGLAHAFTRHWTGRVDLLRRERGSSVPGQDFDENAISVSLLYRR